MQYIQEIRVPLCCETILIETIFIESVRRSQFLGSGEFRIKLN